MAECHCVCANQQFDHLDTRRSKSRVARGVCREVGRRNVAFPVWLSRNPRVGITKLLSAEFDRGFRPDDIVMIFAVPCLNRSIGLCRSHEGKVACMIKEIEPSILHDLQTNIEEVTRRRDAPGAIFPKQRDFRLVFCTTSAVIAAQCAYHFELLGKFRASDVRKFRNSKLRGTGHGPWLDLAMTREKTTLVSAHLRAGICAV